MKKILSVCIPTFNRAALLDTLLGNLSNELNGIQNQVEVCVSDNFSTDATNEILQKWKDRLPLVYKKTPGL